MARVHDPATVERAIEQAGEQIEDSVDILDDLLETFLLADAERDRAFAQAFLDHNGPQTEKRYAAEVVTAEKRRARDVAYLNLKYAERKANAIERRQSGLQSINKSVNSAYNTAGAR